jgi:RIO kinase 2
MKLDPTVMRTMGPQDFRVLEAVERGMKDHALVPLPLVSSLANLRHGGCHKIVSSLLRDKLLSHENRKHGNVDGYRITNAGYDVLALHHLKQTNVVAGLGPRIGTGKESDVYLASDREGRQIVLKFHRLGRTSFRNVKQKRDYSSRQASQSSWLFLSRLSALREHCFMKALHEVQYPTPIPLGHNRHVVCMSLVRGIPLYQIYPSQLSAEQAQDIYRQALGLARRLAGHGLVHCDLNEFNLLVDLSGIQAQVATSCDEDPYVRHSGQESVGGRSLGALSKPSFLRTDESHISNNNDNNRSACSAEVAEPASYLDNGQPRPLVTLIDFPQMVSTSHPNARELYEHDLHCLRRFFANKLRFQMGEDGDGDEERMADAKWESGWASETGEIDEVDNGTKDSRRSKNGGHGNQRIQLDTQLRASGYAPRDSQDLELYYFESGPRPVASAIIQEEDEEEEQGSDSSCNSSDDDDHENYEHRNNGSNGDVSSDDKSSTSHDDHVLREGNGVKPSGVDVDDGTGTDDEDHGPDGSTKLDEQHRLVAEERAKARARKQIEGQKRKQRRHGAFRKRNSSKTFVKGKRIYAEAY